MRKKNEFETRCEGFCPATDAAPPCESEGENSVGGGPTSCGWDLRLAVLVRHSVQEEGEQRENGEEEKEERERERGERERFY